MDWEKMLKGECKGHKSHCSCDHKKKKDDDHKKHDDHSKKKWNDHNESKNKSFFENIAFGTTVNVFLDGYSVTARFVGISGSMVTLSRIVGTDTVLSKISLQEISAVELFI